MQTRLLIVRHGSTDMNGEASRIRGHLPIGLSSKGHSDMARTADALRGKSLGEVHTSPLPRAVQSAQHIAVDAVPNHNLSTWDTGHYTGRPTAEVKPQLAYHISNPDAAPPGGEPYNNFYSRWSTAVHDGITASRQSGQPVTFVTHESNILALPHILTGGKEPLLATSEKTPPPGSVLHVSEDGEGALHLGVLHEGK